MLYWTLASLATANLLTILSLVSFVLFGWEAQWASDIPGIRLFLAYSTIFLTPTSMDILSNKKKEINDEWKNLFWGLFGIAYLLIALLISGGSPEVVSVLWYVGMLVILLYKGRI